MLRCETPQRIYDPVSQAMTDSDSEKENHNLNTNLHAVKNSTNYFQRSALELERQQDELNIKQFRKHQQELPNPVGEIKEQNLKRFQMYPNALRSNFTGNGDATYQRNNLSNFNSDYDDRLQTDADNIAILGASDTKNSMSYPRQCCFILSLLVCVLAIVGFFLMPCGKPGTCPALIDRILSHNWMNNYTKIELKGIINVVNGIKSWEKNLIFLYRGDAYFSEFEQKNTKRNGIISIIGSSGKVAWFDETIEEPIAIDCTLLDVDNNGTPDCLVIDEYGQLSAIDPISGHWYWKFKDKSKHKIDALDFPIILPDLDGDNIPEIMIATSPLQDRPLNFIHRRGQQNNIESMELPTERNFLQILSGRTGKSMGEGYKIYDCDYLRKFQFEHKHLVTYNCVKNKTEVQHSKTLTELFSLITNKSIGQKLITTTNISQHRHYGQRKETDAQRNIYSLNGRELVIENRGKCPEDCNMSFILSELNDGKVSVLRNFSASRMYGMVPAQWHFSNGESRLSGFVVKFWGWNRTSTNNDTFSQANEYSQQRNHVGFYPNWFSGFENIVQMRDTHTISAKNSRLQQNIVNTTTRKTDRYDMQVVTETVFVIIFNGADTRIENTSQANIVQFCHKFKELKEVICQPDLNNQENSLLIADLDQDGSQELVSYYSTFVNHENTWKLVTFVQLLRLESELPSFYRTIEHN